MGLHTELTIYKTAYDLCGIVVEQVRNMPRDIKQVLGRDLLDRCFRLTTLIQRANMARAKLPHFDSLLEELQLIEVELRLARDKRFVSTKGYGPAIELTTSIGKQANALRRKFSPVA